LYDAILQAIGSHFEVDEEAMKAEVTL